MVPEDIIFGGNRIRLGANASEQLRAYQLDMKSPKRKIIDGTIALRGGREDRQTGKVETYW